MRLLIYRVLLSCSLIGSASIVQAGAFKSSEALLAKCSSAQPSDWGICLGYVQGVADSLETLKGWQVPFDSGYACFPERIQGEQLRDVIVVYLAQNPDLLPYAAAGVAMKALVADYPCD